MSAIASLGVSWAFSTETQTIPNGQTHRHVRARLEGLTPETKPTAVALVEAMSKPASVRQLNDWIAAMHAATKHRSEDTAGLALVRDLYRALLSRYPLHVAREACVAITTGADWFPTAKELTEECEARNGKFQAVAAAIRIWRPQPVESGEPSDEELLLAERHDVNRRLGVVGDITKLCGERKALWDRSREIDARLREIRTAA